MAVRVSQAAGREQSNGRRVGSGLTNLHGALSGVARDSARKASVGRRSRDERSPYIPGAIITAPSDSESETREHRNGVWSGTGIYPSLDPSVPSAEFATVRPV